MSQTTATLTQPEVDWINLAAGAIDRIDDALAIEAAKRKMLEAARQTIEDQVGEIHVGEDFEIETLSGFMSRRITMASIGEDPNDEIDTGHDTGKMTGMDGKDFAALINAQSLIVKQVEKLRKEKNRETNEPLFTNKEIAEAIWAPLMRRKLIPENAIPDRYSEVARTFSGASSAYDTRLAAFTDGLSKFDKALEAMGIAKDVIDGAAALATGVTADLGSLGITKDPYEVATIIKGVQLGLDSVTTVTSAVLKENGEFNWKSMEAICKDLQKTVPALINASEAGKSWDDVNFGKALAYAVGGAFSAPLIIKKIKDGKYVEILDDLGDMTLAACNVFTYDIKSTGASDKGPGGSGTLQTNEFGAALSTVIKTGSAALVELLKDEKPDSMAMLRIMQVAAKATIDATSLIQFDHEKKEIELVAAAADGTVKATDDQTVQPDSKELAITYGVVEPEWQAMRDLAAGSTSFATPEKIFKEVQARGTEALKKLHEDDPLVKSMAKYAEAIDKQQKAIMEAGLATLDDELAADDKAFRDLLARSESGDDEGEVEKIEQLVMQLKKDQLITDMALQLVSLPAQAVAAFLPQANIAVAAIELVKNIRKAIEHFRAYFEWQEHTRDAHSAMSIQVEAMANRMNISGGKGRDEILSALENAARVAAGAVGCAGPFAPAGHVVSATVASISTIRQLITKYATEAELRKGWSLYKSALDNPEDRKTIRSSIRKNPTLSKYVIAWGAEVDGNPVAKSALQKCGLTVDVLSNPGTNISKVVSYLEALYPEDPALLRPVDRPESWYPGPVEFTAASVATFSGAAESTKPALSPGACDALIAAFTRLEKLGAAAKKNHQSWRDAVAATAAAVDSLPDKDPGIDQAKKAERAALLVLCRTGESALSASQALLSDLTTFKPVDTAGKPHPAFSAYLKMLIPVARQFVVKFKDDSESWTAEAES